MRFVFLAFGLFAFTGALLDADWYLNLTKSGRRGFNFPFTRKFTRIFHGTIGFVFIMMGLFSGF